MADSFKFFKSFYEAIEALPAENVKAVICAISRHAFYEEEPELGGVDKAIYTLLLPIVDKTISISSARSEASKGHGAPEGNQNALSDKQIQTKSNKFKQNQTSDEKKQTDKDIGYRNKDKDEEYGIEDKDSGEEKESATHSPKRTRFVPPTLDEVKDYCYENNYSVDPVNFWKYFEKGHWIDSKGNKVRNWKQKLFTWESMERKGHGDNRASNNVKSFNPTEYLLQQIREEEAKIEQAGGQ